VDVSRVVRLRTPVPNDASKFAFGSGYVVGPETILTAAHVVESAEENCQVLPCGASPEHGWQDGIVQCRDIEMDLAVVRVLQLAAKVPLVKWGRLLGTTPVPWEAIGFPVAGLDKKGRQPETAWGQVSPATAEPAEELGLVIESREARPAEDRSSGWRGLSGAAVFSHHRLVGVVTKDPPTFGGSLTARRVSCIETRPEINAVLGAPDFVSIAAEGHLDLAVASRLCTQVTQRTVEELEVSRRVDLSRRVARQAVDKAVDAFKSGGALVLALLGPSGVGKSTELAVIATRSTTPSLLIRGASSILIGSRHVGDAVNAAVKSVPSDSLLPDDAASAIADASATSPGFVVIVDGLNEMPWATLPEWALQSRLWLAGVNARLIVSCRPEAWEIVRQAFDPNRRPEDCVVVPLGTFTDDEYRQALHAYGVSIGADLPILHLPLAISLFARLSEPPRAEGHGSFDELIESFINDAAVRVTTKSGAPFTPSMVVTSLQSAAVALMDRGDDELTLASCDALGPIGTGHLVDEGVLSMTPEGYRFVYDDVCDWLMAPAVDLDTALRQLGGRNFRRVGAIASALRAVERRDGADALRGRLDSLFDQTGAEEFGTPQRHLIEETLLKIADARPYISVLRRLADLEAGANDRLARFGDLAFWRSVPLPLNDRLGLLRDLVTNDNYRPWRPKDWAMMPGDWRRADYSPAALTFVLVAENPAEGTRALMSWCADERRLEGGEATVADVAMGILYRLRNQDPEGVWHVINALRMRPPELCLTICNDDPPWIVKQLVSNGQQTTDEVFVGALYHLARSEVDKQSASVLMSELANRYERGLPPEMVSSALAVLATWTKQTKYARILTAGYVSNDPSITAYTLARLAKHAPEVVMPILTEAISLGGARGAEAMLALMSAEDSNTQRSTDDAVLRCLDAGIGPSGYPLFRYIECRTLVSATASPGLLAVIRAAIAAPNGAKSPLLYALTSPDALRGDSQTRTSLLNELIEQADAALLETLLRVAVGQLREEPPVWEALTTVRKIMPLIDQDSADRVLIGEAYFDEAFAVRLSRWLADGTLEAPGRGTAKLRDRVAAGEAPESVLKKIIGL
jgi:hypothetical protein